MKTLLAVCLITLSCLSIPGCGGKGNKTALTSDTKYTVGFLMETYDLDRWKRDESFFSEKSRSVGVTVLRAVADGDQDRQNKQAETLLTQGVNALVVVPKNLNTAARIVTSAHEKNVPVLAYDRLIVGCDLDMYITFDNEKVGYLQAEGVLQKVPEGNFILLGGAASDNNAKLLREGQLRAIKEHELKTNKKITILADPFLDDWDRDEARRKVGNLITKFNAGKKRIDAIIASNDATAGGVVAALQAEKMDRKIAVSGQDAELQACQRIVEGTQTVTVYKPVQLLAEVSAQVAYRLSKKERPEDIIKGLGYTVNYLDNGFKKVPSIFLEPVFVTKENIAKTVIADGWQTLEKVYANVPKDQWPK